MAEGGGLLNRYTLQRRIEGSNPSVSARIRQTLAIASMRQTEAAPIGMRRKISSDVRLARAAGANRGPLVSKRNKLKSRCRAELSRKGEAVPMGTYCANQAESLQNGQRTDLKRPKPVKKRFGRRNCGAINPQSFV